MTVLDAPELATGTRRPAAGSGGGSDLAGAAATATPRVMVVWCPDWPVVAAVAAEELSADDPVAVVAANEVVACSAAARPEGVRRGRRRDSTARWG